MITVIINGTEYELSTTLRVAYKVQGQHDHKPYTEVFKGLGDMTLEQQINILYASFQCANPFACKEITAQKFLDYYLDHYNLKVVMDQLQAVVKGIMGTEDEDETESDSSEENAQGN
jgi:hypothetical protein